VGTPVADAEVHIDKVPSPIHYARQLYRTDDAGNFAIGRVPWGTYRVNTGKEESGYPDSDSDFYSNNEVPTVTISPEHPDAKVTLRLLPKAGVIEVSAVRDARTGKPIAAGVMLRRAANPDLYLSTSRLRVLVPARIDVSVEVTAGGYEPRQLGVIRLEPGEVRKFDVALNPTPPAR